MLVRKNHSICQITVFSFVEILEGIDFYTLKQTKNMNVKLDSSLDQTKNDQNASLWTVTK